MTNLKDTDTVLQQIALDHAREIRVLRSLLFGLACTVAAGIGYWLHG